MHIALLEDQPAVMDVLTTMLRLQGYQVQAYHDGSSLLRALFEQDTEVAAIDVALVILADTVAGNIPANEVIRVIRQRLTPEQLPIIVLSGSFRQEKLLHAQFPEMPIVREPFHIKDVLAEVRRWVQKA